ncbi:MAG TPA: DMT family transporter [Burkholderiales bacterium]|jgi:transporter family-2 protein|nr:DMT family transporter [Burkholderiales bacterium]
MKQLFFAALALFVGALIPIQAATNAAMAKVVGDFSIAALALFLIGLATVSGWMLVTQPALPSFAQLSDVPAYGYLGGVIVASYVLAITYLAPRMGVGNAICFVVTGQIIAAVVIDHFGLFGANLTALNWQRSAGIVLMIVGLFLAKR